MQVLSKVRNNRTSVEINMINVEGEEDAAVEVDVVPAHSEVPSVAPMPLTCSPDPAPDLNPLQRTRVFQRPSQPKLSKPPTTSHLRTVKPRLLKPRSKR